MKRLHIYLLGLTAALFHACSPYEKRITPADPAGIQLDFSVTQNPAYDNQVTLESKTKDVIPFWDYGFGTSKLDKAVVIMPFAGDFYVKYSAYGTGGPKTDSVKVTISENDPLFFPVKCTTCSPMAPMAKPGYGRWTFPADIAMVMVPVMQTGQRGGSTGSMN